MEQIAVVGCGGMIGEVICKNLCKDYIVKGGQRHEPTKLMKINNFKWCYLDIFDTDNLNSFCADCTIVINCAGPEFMIKSQVAKAAIKAGAIYIDVSNAILIDQEDSRELIENGVCYVGAGFYPGISGLLLKRVTDELLDQTDCVNCYVGGAERYTKTSLSDILMSAYSSIGKTDCYWKENGIVEDKINMLKKEFVSGIDAPVYKKLFISREILDILKLRKIEELHWYNIASNDFMLRLAVQFYQLQQEVSLEDALKQLQLHLGEQSKDEWIALVINALGMKNGKNVRCQLNLQVESSYEMTGTVAAQVARNVIYTKRSNGIYWANEVLPLDFVNHYNFSNDYDFYDEKIKELTK